MACGRPQGTAVYKVAVTDFVSGAGAFVGESYYPAFADGAATASTSFGATADIFKEYVASVGVLEKLPLDQYSTQNFIADPPANDTTSPAHLTTLSMLVAGIIATSAYCM